MFEFCLPTRSTTVPTGPDWLHEIEYDGYRVRLERDAERVRLITMGRYDSAKRYPRIVEAALKNRQKLFVIDGEATTSMRCTLANIMTRSRHSRAGRR